MTMCTNIALLEKREELKHQLATGKYKTLIDRILDGASYLIKKATRTSKPVPFWYSATVIALFVLLVGFLTALLLKEAYYYIRPEHVAEDVAFVGCALFALIALRIYLHIVFTTLHDYILDSIESASDLADLQRWLAIVVNLKMQLTLSLAYMAVTVLWLLISVVKVDGGFPGFGYVILAVLIQFLAGMIVCHLFPFLALPLRLSRYQFKLYMADPSSSEVISHLSGMLTNFAYLLAAVFAIGAALSAVFGWLILINILAVFVPLTVLFIINQYSLARIIGRAKWRMLSEIQAQVEELRAQEYIPSEQTLEHISKLMDYHDRIKATRNTALDFRAGLNYLNTLLLPLLGFVLGNIDNIQILRKLFQ